MRDVSGNNGSTCLGKIPYGSAGDARTAAQGLARRVGAKYTQKLTAYRCTACGAFHTGNDRNRGRGKARIKKIGDL